MAYISVVTSVATSGWLKRRHRPHQPNRRDGLSGPRLRRHRWTARQLPLVLVLLAATTSWASSRREGSIRRFANQWLGTPYQWGGTTRSGIDCSAFLREMYRSLFRVELPRTTKQQIHLGRSLALSRKDLARGLEPGDLIFYVDRSGMPNHVVVYAGHRQITHSVSGRGVVIERIDRLYGRRLVARRLLVPAADGSSMDLSALAAAGPIEVIDVPCPSRYVASKTEVRSLSQAPMDGLAQFEGKNLCELRALEQALRALRNPMAQENADQLSTLIEWQEKIGEASSWLQTP